VPGETQTRWTVRIPSIRSPDKYCRVEVEGSRIEDEPVALVKEARLAVVIAALPEIVDALRGLLEHLGPGGYIPGAGKPATDAAHAALAKMEGRDAID